MTVTLASLISASRLLKVFLRSLMENWQETSTRAWSARKRRPYWGATLCKFLFKCLEVLMARLTRKLPRAKLVSVSLGTQPQSLVWPKLWPKALTRILKEIKRYLKRQMETLINQAVPQLLQLSWRTINSKCCKIREKRRMNLTRLQQNSISSGRMESST